MMAVVEHEQFLSFEGKAGNLLTAEEERDHYRKRFQSMKLVLKELQQQLTLYKTRCAGVDTIALMLQESKQEVVKLTKQRKALETAIANLQNRLSTNGLSSSVNIEETELFVPGASKQTLDNLAKENARLRALLKSHEGQTGKKPSEDIQRMTILVEQFEAENNLLRAQLLELGHLKLALTNQYEDEIKKIKAEKLQLEQELDQHQEGQIKSTSNSETNSEIIGLSKGSQTLDMIPSKVDDIRRALKLLSDHCAALDQSLENCQIPAKNEMCSETSPMDRDNMVSKEAYLELEQKVGQVVQMNQRWQAYNENQEEQIHGLLAKIAELDELNKEVEELRSALDTKEIENQSLRREIANLTREVNKFRSQPQIDMSLVEILKQQIQVCTEDFNTERKDREHAINRAKQLQEEVAKLTNQNELLKRDVDNLQKIKNTSPEISNQAWMKPQQILPHYSPRPGFMSSQRPPYSSSSSGTSQPGSHSLSPVPSPVPMSFSSTSYASDRSSFYPPNSQESVSGFQTPTRGGFRQQTSHASSQSSMPRARGPQESPPASSVMQKPTATNVSIPALSVKTEGPSNSKEPHLTCPNCGKEFTENQQQELINHINTCHE